MMVVMGVAALAAKTAEPHRYLVGEKEEKKKANRNPLMMDGMSGCVRLRLTSCDIMKADAVESFLPVSCIEGVWVRL